MTEQSRDHKAYPYYVAALLVVASAALLITYQHIGIESEHSYMLILGGFLLCWFTISVGYPHPNFGHVSFDRVGQTASILFFGPVIAALISGLASFIFPIARLLNGARPADVATACFHNSGLMVLVVLGGGLFYKVTGGVLPLDTVDADTILKVTGMLLVMQIINEVGMSVYMMARKGNPRQIINLFNTGLEVSAGFIGVLLTIIYIRTETGVFLLALAVLTVGMFALQRFALMRNHLESLVKERTAELEAKSKELERKATHDKLTGLYNRRYADDYLESQIEQSLRYQENFTVALADIDHFKQVNDRYSHEMGDYVLKEVSNLLSSNSRASDIISRYGGEEFLLCFPKSNANEALAVCEKLRSIIETYDWSRLGPNVSITLSFGIAQIDVNSRRKTILREADERLYAAKNLGRNRVVA